MVSTVTSNGGDSSTSEHSMDEARTEFVAINQEMNKNLKSVCPLIQNLLEKIKNEPQLLDTEKVCHHFFFYRKVTIGFSMWDK